MEIQFTITDGMQACKVPGCVIRVEGQIVMMKHGSVYISVHPSCLMHENVEFETNTMQIRTRLARTK